MTFSWHVCSVFSILLLFIFLCYAAPVALTINTFLGTRSNIIFVFSHTPSFTSFGSGTPIIMQCL